MMLGSIDDTIASVVGGERAELNLAEARPAAGGAAAARPAARRARHVDRCTNALRTRA